MYLPAVRSAMPKVTNNANESESNSGLDLISNMNTTYKFTDRFNIATFTVYGKIVQSIQTTYNFIILA